MRPDLRPLTVKTLAMVICGTVAIAWTAAQPSPSGERGVQKRYAAVAFDFFALFSPGSIVPVVEQVAPGKGREFSNLWRTRQFEYSWLRSITSRYVDFSAITEDALLYTASAMHVDLTAVLRLKVARQVAGYV